MIKIPCLFERAFHGFNNFTLLDKVTPGCEWVLAGEGVATEKFDGTACLYQDGVLYKRYDAKRGKTPPAGAIPCCEPDSVTGHHPHWVAISDKPEDKWHREGLVWLQRNEPTAENGTYELVGPGVSANPHGLTEMKLWQHGFIRFPEITRTFEGIRAFLEILNGEGLVFHHPDGRMAKIRRTDFGFAWNQHKGKAA